MTPGSGAAARAAMELGIQYSCLCRSSEHSSWLQNILDRHALRLGVLSGSPLYEQDLAQCIKEHFQDIVDQLNEADVVEDTAPEDFDDVGQSIE